MSTFSNQLLLHTQANIPLSTQYSYPATCLVMEVGNESKKIHLIFVDTDFTTALLTPTDGTGLGNAPIGSVVFQYLTATPRIAIKVLDSTWKTISATWS
jgi:hypothetical protein